MDAENQIIDGIGLPTPLHKVYRDYNRLRPISAALIVFAIFVVLGTISLILYWHWVQEVGLLASPESVQELYAGADVGSYLSLAIDLASGQVQSGQAWVFAMWPPGMPLLEALAIRSGIFLPFMVLMTSVVWALPPTLIAYHSRVLGVDVIGFVFSGIWVFMPFTWFWTWSGGFLSADSFGLAFGLCAVIFITIAWVKLNLKESKVSIYTHSAVGGVFMALAIYMRWGSVIVAMIILVLLTGWVAIYFVRLIFFRGEIRYERRNPLAISLPFIIALLVLTVPWSWYKTAVLGTSTLAWQDASYSTAFYWQTDEDLRSIGAGWLVDGRVNWPCNIDPIKCAELRPIALNGAADESGRFTREALSSALAYPITYAQDRASMMFESWFALPGDSSRNSRGFVFGVASLLLVGLLAFNSIYLRRKATFPTLVWTLAIVGSCSVFLRVHMETRYLMTVTTTIATTWALSALLRYALAGASTDVRASTADLQNVD